MPKARWKTLSSGSVGLRMSSHQTPPPSGGVENRSWAVSPGWKRSAKSGAWIVCSSSEEKKLYRLTSGECEHLGPNASSAFSFTPSLSSTTLALSVRTMSHPPLSELDDWVMILGITGLRRSVKILGLS